MLPRRFPIPLVLLLDPEGKVMGSMGKNISYPGGSTPTPVYRPETQLGATPEGVCMSTEGALELLTKQIHSSWENVHDEVAGGRRLGHGFTSKT